MIKVTRPGLLRNLQIGFGLSLFILIVTSVASYSSISNLLAGSQRVDHTDSVLIKVDRVLAILRDAESGQRGFLLTGDTSFLTPSSTASERVRVIIDSVEDMTADNPIQVRNIEDLKKVI